MNKYEWMIENLKTNKECKSKAFGNSMTPLLHSGCLLTYKACDNYNVGDIVFCKVKGRYIDAHIIIKKDSNKGYLIANNHGFENGWTHTVYGKVVEAYQKNITVVFD